MSAVNAPTAPLPDAIPVKLAPPTPLPLLSVTIAVIVALPRLETVSGDAVSVIAAGGPALITTVAIPEAPDSVAVAVIVTFPAAVPEV